MGERGGWRGEGGLSVTFTNGHDNKRSETFHKW